METARDVAGQYAKTKVGEMPANKFLKYTKTSEEYKNLPEEMKNKKDPKYMLEVFIDDFISLCIRRCQSHLYH